MLRIIKKYAKIVLPVVASTLVLSCSPGTDGNAPANEAEAIDQAAYRGDWDEVLRLTTSCWGSDFKAYYRNLAFAHKGLLADSLMHHYAPFERALFYPVDEHGNSFTITAAGEAWWFVGDLTMAEHATMLGMIFSKDHKSVRHLQRLYQINMAAGNQACADKYRRMLEAEGAPLPEAATLLQYREGNEWMISAVHTADIDTLRLTGQYQEMLRSVLDQNALNEAAREYLLCLDLLYKDLNAFAADIEQYGFFSTSPLYQEAMLILMDQHPELREPWKPYISEACYRDFMKVTQMIAQNAPISAFEHYRNTYWYYFKFATKRS